MRSRNKQELELIRKSGAMTAKALKKVLASVREGISLIELDKLAEEEILKLGGKPSFKTVPGYKWATCLTINDEVVHGIPRDIKLKKGDKLSIDVGTVYKGWHTDVAWSVMVEGKGEETKHGMFLLVGEKALWAGVAQAVDGKRVGDISAAIQNVVEGAGCSVVRSLVGHGVGKALHEDPQIPGFGKRGTGMILKSGMSLAIEAIYTAGIHQVVTGKDKWTIKTKDGSLGGLFEMSVVVGKVQAEVLTDWRKY